MRSGVRVRVAETGDVADLMHLAEQDTPSPSRDAERVIEARTARYRRLLASPDRVVLVAVDEDTDRPIGMIIATDDELAATSSMRALVVGNLVVALRHRRRGVGRALLTALVRQADERGIEQIVVAAASNDRDANRYLARLGFHPLVIRRIATTATLRRSLGMGELVDRALLRRRRGVRSVLSARASNGA